MRAYKSSTDFGIKIKAVFLTLLFVVSLAFSGYTSFQGSTVSAEAAYNDNPNLKYFGYFHAECSSQLNEIPNLGRVGNVNIIYLNILDEQSYPTCLQSAKDNNVKVILSPVEYFWGNTYYSGNPVRYSDITNTYNRFKSLISGYEDNIYAFYFDEPVWNKVPATDFVYVTGILRADYPAIGSFVFEATPILPVFPPRSYYQHVTDFGIDWYAEWTNFSDWSIDSYKTFYARFISELYSPGQKIWIIPQTFTNNPNPNIPLMESILNDYYSFAQTDSRIVGMLNFVFSIHTAPHLGYGLSKFFDPASPMYYKPGAASYRGLHSQLAKTITNPTVPKDVLLSRNVAVSASSTYPGTSPGNVVDGNIATNWNGGGFPSKWVELNLGQPQTISTIRMLPNQTPGGYTVNTIQVKRTAAEPYTTVRTLSMNTDGNTWVTYVSGLQLANVQYIRFTTSTSPSWVSWKEIEVYGPANSTPALLSASGATASSSYLSYTPNLAIDNNTGTSWNGGGFPAKWIDVDLGAQKTLTAFRLLTNQSPSGATTHNIYVKSNINDAYTLAKTFNGTTTGDQWLEHYLLNAVSNVRYVRVETTVSPSWVAWKEISLYGY